MRRRFEEAPGDLGAEELGLRSLSPVNLSNAVTSLVSAASESE